MQPASASSISDAPSFVQLDGIGKRYGGVSALEQVTLDIRRNEFLTLLGPSGSGKTTTLMCLAGFVEPDAGRILVEGREITRLRPERRNFGVVFQGYALFPHMNVAENVAYPLRIRKIGRTEREAKAKDALQRVGLSGFEGRAVRSLSGGQQQRVALARALVFSPALLLLDEPLSALDRQLRIEMQSELSRIHREAGTTFVFVTHDQHEALSMSDRVAVFNKGRIEQVASPRQLYDRPATRFIAEFVGETNLVPVDVLEPAGDGLYHVRLEDAVVTCEGPGDMPSGRASLCLRPEAGELVDRPSRNSEIFIPVRVEVLAYFGTHAEITARDRRARLRKVSLPVSHPLLASLSKERDYGMVWPSGAGFLVADQQGRV